MNKIIYAYNIKNEKIKAEPNKIGYCIGCGEKLIPKCGSIKMWHWSHKNNSECDSFSEGETMWHLNWKTLVKKEFCEVKIGNHRADIYDPNKKLVIELQNSPISSESIKERENFYGNMLWVFNGKDFNIEFTKKNKSNSIQFDLNNNKIYSPKIFWYWTFRWKHPRKTLWASNKKIFIDLNGGIFEIKKLYNNVPCRGWGYFMDKDEFVKKYMGGLLRENVL